MPTFEIPDGPTTVELKRSGDAPATGSIVFNVTNKSSDSCAGRLSVVPSGSSKEAWFTIDGDRERTFNAGETQTATIKISTPKEVAAGDYPFRLRAVAVNDPDNDHAEGPVATAKVPPPPPPPKPTKWWLWLIIGLVVLLVLGIGGYFIAKALGGGGEETTNTVVANNTAPVPDFAGKTVDQAKAEAQGFNLAEQPGTPSGKQPRTILSQLPAAGSQQAAGAVVQVTFDPGVTVPGIVGQNVGQAVRTLQGVPLHVQTSTTRCENSGNADEIIDQDPKPGAVVTKDSGVNVVVRTVGGMFGATRLHCGQRIPNLIFLNTVKATPSFQTMSVAQRFQAVRGLQEPPKKP
jgi:hypothetical protein